ncbi:MAG: hypothetical protein AAFO62_09070 [Pseudomonadota bacterium]
MSDSKVDCRRKSFTREMIGGRLAAMSRTMTAVKTALDNRQANH